MAEVATLGTRQRVRFALVSVSISLGLPGIQATFWKRVQVLRCKKANKLLQVRDMECSKVCMETR
jgi:hypothetical protein